MKLKALILACLLGLAPACLQAGFTMPLIDVTKSVTSTAASFVIWSNSSVTEPAGNTVVVVFPRGITLPAVTIASCYCIFMKFSMTPDGKAFSASEVTVTAGSINGQAATIAFPRDIGPGLFYIRFDSTMGIKTPDESGLFTLLLTESNGNTMESRGVIIRDNYNNNVTSTASITGSVVDGSAPVGGALVFASTFDPLSASNDDFFLYQEVGPRGTTITPTGTVLTPTAKEAMSYQSFSAFTRSDGTFSINVPYRPAPLSALTYYVYTVFSKKNGSVMETWRTTKASSTPSVSFSSATSQSVNLSTFQKIVP